MLIESVVGRVQGKLSNAVTSLLRLTATQSLAVAQFEAEGDEATRAGARFVMSSAAATGIAPVQALPTTAAQWLIYNPAANSNVVWLDVVGMLLNSGTAGAGAVVLMGLCGSTQLPSTRPAVSAAGIVLSNANPRSSKTSQLIVASGQTLAASPGWSPLAQMSTAGTILGQTIAEQRDVKGRIALAPDSGLALVVISPTGTTPLFAPYATYREYASDTE